MINLNKRVALGLGLAAVPLLLAACGSSGAGSPKTVYRTTVRTATATVTATPSPDSTDATDSSDPSDSSTDGAVTDGAVPTASGIVAPSRAGSTLTSSDFFSANGWSDNVVDVANQKGVQGVTSDVDCGDPQELELRLNDAFTSLKFSVGQDNTSSDSNDQMTVTVTANGHQVLARQVGFNTVSNFSINVTDVNALQIDFTDKDSNCDNGIGAVFFNGVVK